MTTTTQNRYSNPGSAMSAADDGGRPMDACKVARITGTDERGRYCAVVVECPDCHAFIESAPLRTAAAISALLSSDISEHHRCAPLLVEPIRIVAIRTD